MVHGEYRLDNVLVVGEGDDPHVSAVLDWEMATLGDPLVDLGIFALYWDIADLPGISAAEARRIVAVRGEIHGFSSLEDLGMTMDLPGDVVERLRGRVVCIPR